MRAINYKNDEVEIVGLFSDTPYFSVTELLTKEVSDRTPIPLFISKLLKFGIIQSGEFFQNMNIEDVEESMKNISKLNLVFPRPIFFLNSIFVFIWIIS